MRAARAPCKTKNRNTDTDLLYAWLSHNRVVVVTEIAMKINHASTYTYNDTRNALDFAFLGRPRTGLAISPHNCKRVRINVFVA